jgi:thiamine biosynthesis lipoprotein
MSSAFVDSVLGAETSDAPFAVRSMPAIGTAAMITVTDADRADDALALLADDLRAIDEACSRFRPDSELRQVEQRSLGAPVPISPLLFEALEVACEVAVKTAGIVDPTIGSALVELGYDRDFDAITSGDHPPGYRALPAPGWWRITLDPEARTAAVPAGVHIDLGATAKALVADRSAQRIASAFGCGVLVNLGGDVAVAGRCPKGGWAIGIAADPATPIDAVDQVVTIFAGGLATSGTTARSWVRHGRVLHHIVDPWTGESAPAVWSLVSTTAPSCVEANAWSTAAIVWGHDAIGNLSALDVPARLVDVRGRIVPVAGWPVDSIGPVELMGDHLGNNAGLPGLVRS